MYPLLVPLIVECVFIGILSPNASLFSQAYVGRMDGPNLPFVPTKEDSDDKFADEVFIIMIVIAAAEEDNNTILPQCNLPLQGAMYITYTLKGHPVPCYQMFCMEPSEFISLCVELRECGLMRSTKNLDVEESVVMFVLITGQCQGQRIAVHRFMQKNDSGRTITCCSLWSNVYNIL